MLLAGAIFVLTIVLVIWQPKGLGIGWSAMLGAGLALISGVVHVGDIRPAAQWVFALGARDKGGKMVAPDFCRFGLRGEIVKTHHGAAAVRRTIGVCSLRISFCLVQRWRHCLPTMVRHLF